MKLLIADDHAVICRGVCESLEESPLNLEISEASSACEVLKSIKDHTYDIIVLDIHFPDGNGLDLLEQIQTCRKQTRVLMFSLSPEEQYARRTLRLGASGYLTKNCSPNELVLAIQKVAEGGKYISQVLAESLADEICMQAKLSPHQTLSEREFQVLTWLGAGKSIKEIAVELALSPRRVSTYRSRVLEKINLKTTADLIRYALRTS